MSLQIKPGAIELHPEELAIVVNYEVRFGDMLGLSAPSGHGRWRCSACGYIGCTWISIWGALCDWARGSGQQCSPRERGPLARARAVRDPAPLVSFTYTQVQEVSTGPDGAQQILSREAATKK